MITSVSYVTHNVNINYIQVLLWGFKKILLICILNKLNKKNSPLFTYLYQLNIKKQLCKSVLALVLFMKLEPLQAKTCMSMTKRLFLKQTFPFRRNNSNNTYFFKFFFSAVYIYICKLKQWMLKWGELTFAVRSDPASSSSSALLAFSELSSERNLLVPVKAASRQLSETKQKMPD